MLSVPFPQANELQLKYKRVACYHKVTIKARHKYVIIIYRQLLNNNNN